MKKYVLVFVAAAVLALGWFGIAKAGAGHLVISQVQVGVTGNSNDEFVELYNPGGANVDLSALPLKLHIRNSSGSDSNKPLTFVNTVVPAGGYFLIGPASGYAGTTTLDATYSASGNLLVSNGSVYISTSSTASVAVIDKLGWGSQPDGGFEAAPFSQVLSSGQVMLRDNNSDTDNNAADFLAAASCARNSTFAGSCSFFPSQNSTSTDSSTASSTPSATSTAATQSPDIKIYRFLPNPAGDDAGNEWVELQNTGTADVSVDGWLLDDKNTGSGPGSDAYVLSGSIAAGAVVRFTLPVGSFALNNSGGDEVNLYWADKTLADTAVYAVSAPDDAIFEFSGGIWQPPATIEQSSSGGGGSAVSGSLPASTPYTYVAPTVHITEILPDPQGADEGNEWIELYNYGDSAIKLNGWILDNGVGSSSPSSTAYTIGSITVAAKHFAPIIIPKNKFSLANSGQDGVRLFTSGKQLLETVVYQNPIEGLSYAARSSGQWEFTVPTPGAANLFDVPVADVSITELLPNPGEGDEEFVELYNASSAPVSLRGFRLDIGNHEKTFDDATVPPASYLVLYEDDLPVKLPNNGQSVDLFDQWGRKLGEAMYAKAPRGQAFAWSGTGFTWTEQPTPGADNQLVLAASTADVSLAPKQNSAIRIATVAKTAAGATEKNLQREVAALSKEVSSLEQQLAQVTAAPLAEAAAPAAAVQAPDARQNGLLAALSLIFSSLALLGVVGKYLAALSKK